MNLHEIEKTLEEKFERVSIRRVVGDLFMVFDDPGHAFILVEELSQILEEVEPKGRDLYDDYEEFWNEIGKREISDISEIYESQSRLFPTVRDALEPFNLHDKNEIKKTLFWDEYESDLDEVILVPTSDGYFWFETNFAFDAPKIREYANREVLSKIYSEDVEDDGPDLSELEWVDDE